MSVHPIGQLVWTMLLSCECCDFGCDCGCALECPRVGHKEAAGMFSDTSHSRRDCGVEWVEVNDAYYPE